MSNVISVHDQELFHLFNYNKEIDVNKFSIAQSLFEKLNKDLLDKLEIRIKEFKKTMKGVEETKYTLQDCLAIVKNYERLIDATGSTIELLSMFEFDEPVFRKLNKRLIQFNEQNKQIQEKFYLYADVYHSKKDIKDDNTLSFEEVFEDEL